MGRKSYNSSNLQQCAKNLFQQAYYELRAIHKLEYAFIIPSKTSNNNKVKVLSFWDNDEDCFYATGFEIWKFEDSKIIIELYVLVKYSDYKCSIIVGTCNTPQEVYEWLLNNESLQKCLNNIDSLISNID